MSIKSWLTGGPRVASLFTSAKEPAAMPQDAFGHPQSNPNVPAVKGEVAVPGPVHVASKQTVVVSAQAAVAAKPAASGEVAVPAKPESAVERVVAELKALGEDAVEEAEKLLGIGPSQAVASTIAPVAPASTPAQAVTVHALASAPAPASPPVVAPAAPVAAAVPTPAAATNAASGSLDAAAATVKSGLAAHANFKAAYLAAKTAHDTALANMKINAQAVAAAQETLTAAATASAASVATVETDTAAAL